MKGYLYGLIRDGINKVDEILSLERIRMDFSKYMDFGRSSERIVNAINERGEAREVLLLKSDRITLITKKIVYGDSRVIHASIHVSIGIGEFIVEDGIYGVEKCTGELFYNEDFELLDVDFYYRRLHDLQLSYENASS